MTDPDRELVERVQGGDQAAFRTLFERYHRRAYAVAYGVVKNKEDALDVVSVEVFDYAPGAERIARERA